MYITIDMLTDPMFWVGLPVFMFFMGGKYSPLSIFKWYRTFWKSIGFKEIKQKGEHMIRKLINLLINNEVFMDYIPCSWGLRLENFVYGSTEEYDYEERTLNYCESV